MRDAAAKVRRGVDDTVGERAARLDVQVGDLADEHGT